jgi:hypothetical protein
MSITLNELLSAGFLPGHTVAGDAMMLRSRVTSVVAAPDVAAVASAEPCALVVFLGVDEQRVRLAIRLAARREAVGVVLRATAADLPERTREFAEASRVVLVLVDDDQPDRVVPAMDQFVRNRQPRRQRDTRRIAEREEDVLGLVANRLRTAGAEPADMLRVLGATLHTQVGLVVAGGRVIAGDLPEAALRGPGDVLERLAAGRPAPLVSSAVDGLLLAQPVQLTAELPPNLWLMAGVTDTRASRVRLISHALSLATWALVAHLAAVSIELAGRDREHLLLLSCLLDEAKRPGLQCVERASALGWRLVGWHTAVRITTRRVGVALPLTAVGALLHRHLSAQDITAVPITGDDDWTLWTTEFSRPASPGDVCDRVRRALLDAERELPGLRLCAGVGTAGEGLPGLRESLTHAREAGLLAKNRDVPCAVEQLGRDSVNRILVGHHSAGPQQQLARHLLRPITDADPTGQLVRTLSCYLDHESSATAAASALGVHRNTVLQRLDRIRLLLDIDLSDVDQRLSLHLATRLLRMNDQERRPGDVGVATAS